MRCEVIMWRVDWKRKKGQRLGMIQEDVKRKKKKTAKLTFQFKQSVEKRKKQNGGRARQVKREAS